MGSTAKDTQRLWAIGIGVALIAAFFLSFVKSDSLYDVATSDLAKLIGIKTWALWLVPLSGAALIASALMNGPTKLVALGAGLTGVGVTIYTTGIAFFLVANWGGVLFIALAAALFFGALLKAKPSTLGFLGGAYTLTFFMPWLREGVRAGFFSNGKTGFWIARNGEWATWVDLCVWAAPVLGAAALISSLGDTKSKATTHLAMGAGAVILAPVIYYPAKGFISEAAIGGWLLVGASLAALSIAALTANKRSA